MNTYLLAQAPQIQPPTGSPPQLEPAPEIEDIIELEADPVGAPTVQLEVKSEEMPPWLVPSILGGAFVLAGLLLYLLTRKKAAVAKTAPPPIPPDEQALNDLRLVWSQQAEFNDKTFASSVSDILRTYIEGEFSIRAPELTTEEFLPEAKGHEDLKDEFAEQLEAFLNLVDLVKFAKMPLEEQQREELYRAATTFVEESHQARLLKISPELSVSAQEAQPAPNPDPNP